MQFIEQKHDKPWLLFLSQLEPHRQNDVDAFVPPKRYEGKYVDPYIPEDLRKLPGNWRSRIPGYYGCVQAIDDCVGTLVAALRKPDILTTVSSFSSRITAALSARGSASINARRTTLRSVYRS